jgi:hypothetical protein
MSASDLEQWLRSEQSVGSGWHRDNESGETVGHERLAKRFRFLV